MSEHQDYYVYLLCRPCGKPFYAGKGRRDRIKQHEYAAKRGSKRHVCNVIRKIWQEGGEVICEKLVTGLSNTEAIVLEIELIAFYGTKFNGGILCNQTNGGDGAEGWKHTEESLKKMREAWETRPDHSEETKKKMSQSQRGRRHSMATRKKMSKAHSGENNWNWGKKITKEHAKMLRELNSKPVVVDGVRYESVAVAGRATRISVGTIAYQAFRAKKNRNMPADWPGTKHQIEAV